MPSTRGRKKSSLHIGAQLGMFLDKESPFTRETNHVVIKVEIKEISKSRATRILILDMANGRVGFGWVNRICWSNR